MNLLIFNKNTIADYKKLMSECSLDLDIYYQPEFLDLEAELIHGQYEIFTLTNRSNHNIFIYPYIKIPHVNGLDDYFDIISPYGYAGPYCNNSDFFNIGEKEFLNYAKNQKIVSEFVRYHFIYNENLQFSQNIQNEHNRTVVIIDLNYKWEHIWMNHVSQNNRNYSNRFNRDGFGLRISETEENIDNFIQMYYQTMENINAEETFFYPATYFYKLFATLKGKVLLGEIIKDNIIYSSVLFFVCGGFVQLYLNGRNLNYKKLPSNVPLYLNIAKWAIDNHLKILNIGGGRTNDSSDSLFFYKYHISNQTRKFYIGKRIHNIDIYNYLINKYIMENGVEKYNIVRKKLQFYR